MRLIDSRWVLALALAAAGCAGSDSMLTPNQGRIRFVLGAGDGAVAVGGPAAVESQTETGVALPGNDALTGEGEYPQHPRIKSANVLFTSILARNLNGVLTNVEMDLPAAVDVIALETGRQVQLPEGELPPAMYDQVVVVMTQVQVVLGDDTTITITPPGGGWTAIVPLCPPVSVGSGETTVSLTLEVRGSLLWIGDRFRFEPRFKPPFGCGGETPPPTPPVL
jgi:hypothetical protein